MGIGSSSSAFRAECCTYLVTVFSGTNSKDMSEFPVKCLAKEGAGDCGSNVSDNLLFCSRTKSEKIFGRSD